MGALVYTPVDWTLDNLPDDARPRDYWVDRGLRSAYVLNRATWHIDRVSGNVGAYTTGAGVSFPAGWLRTSGNATDLAFLYHGLPTPISGPISMIIGSRMISGSVAWSLLRTDSGFWTGWYGGGGGANTVTANAFDGGITVAGDVLGFSQAANGDIRAASGWSFASDAASYPASVSSPYIALGAAVRDMADNPAVAEFTFVAVFQGALEVQELQWLADNPARTFEVEHLVMPLGAARRLCLLPDGSLRRQVPGAGALPLWRDAAGRLVARSSAQAGDVAVDAAP